VYYRKTLHSGKKTLSGLQIRTRVTELTVILDTSRANQFTVTSHWLRNIVLKSQTLHVDLGYLLFLVGLSIEVLMAVTMKTIVF
jgi:hypothetical protein